MFLINCNMNQVTFIYACIVENVLYTDALYECRGNRKDICEAHVLQFYDVSCGFINNRSCLSEETAPVLYLRE